MNAMLSSVRNGNHRFAARRIVRSSGAVLVVGAA
jgi:hypothetical protein